jgi:hypothetical protein
MELLEKTSGPIVYEALRRSEKNVGQYIQLCHDQGGDIVCGTRQYAEYVRETEGRTVIITNDIAHKIANLLAVEAEELGWMEFARRAAELKRKLQFTKWAAYAPPNQRSKSRYMNLDELTDWGKRILKYLEEQEKTLVSHKDFCERKSRKAFQELLDRLGWVREYDRMLQEVSELLLVGRMVRQKVRVEGLHAKTVEELEREFQSLPVQERTDQFSGNIVDFLTEQTRDLKQVALGITEIIESSFGKLKQLMDEDSKDGFTPYILSLAACLGKMDLETVQAALRTCNKQQVKDWAMKNVGETVYSERRRLFNPFKKQKTDFCAKDGGQDRTGIFTGNVVNF